jgi:lipoprotein-anchoring transpeptidase ErfK/SrfK
MLRSLLALGGFALGGTTAALMSPADAPHALSAAPVAKADVPAGRVAVAAASNRSPLKQGMILYPIETILAVPGRMHYGDYRWNEAGVPKGPVWVRVDLKSQIVSVFRGGHEIGTAVILYGADGLPTPTGQFPVLAKLKDHRSQTYDAPMPYTLRLTADGVSIHASNVRWGYATHGCVGVPEEFAAKLFDAVKVGDPVLIVGADGSKKASA